MPFSIDIDEADNWICALSWVLGEKTSDKYNGEFNVRIDERVYNYDDKCTQGFAVENRTTDGTPSLDLKRLKIQIKKEEREFQRQMKQDERLWQFAKDKY